ncbi:MAG: histidine kinase [Bacteroidia bacterium]|nr:histidine kinase [Bacteroidia bacterium]
MVPFVTLSPRQEALYKRLRTIAFHAALWISFHGYNLIIREVRIFGFTNQDGSLQVVTACWLVANLLLFYGHAVWVWPWNKKSARRYYQLSIGLVLIASSLELLADDRVYAAFYPERYKGFYFPNIIFELAFNLLLWLGSMSYCMRVDYRRGQRELAELHQAQLQAELNYLRAQVSPHFLFNTLNNLYGMALQVRASGVAQGIQQLSGMMRYLLYDSSADRVTLAQEIRFVEDFLALQRLRFSADDPIDIRFEVEGGPTDLPIPPLLLICPVENAIKHGLRANQPSWVHIRVSVRPDTLQIWVGNSHFPDLPPNPHTEAGGLGADNLVKRLELLYPGTYQLRQGPVTGRWETELRLPLRKTVTTP